MWRWDKGRQSFFFMVFLSSGSFGNTRYFWFTAILLILCNFKCRTNHVHSLFLLLCIMWSFSFSCSTINNLLLLAPPSLKNSTHLLPKTPKEKTEPLPFLPRMNKNEYFYHLIVKGHEKKWKWLTCKVLTVKQILLLITALTIGDVWSICVPIFEFKAGCKKRFLQLAIWASWS